MSLAGASALHARFRALLHIPDTLEARWADAAAPKIRAAVPRRTGKTARSVRPTRDGVVGSSVVDFLDAGTAAHTIEPKNRTVLKFNARSGTVFSPKARKPAQRGRHFKEPAGREALEEVGGDLIVKTWNGAA